MIYLDDSAMIFLDPIKASLEDTILNWLNDPEICKYNSHAVLPATLRDLDHQTLRMGIYGKSYNPFPTEMPEYKICEQSRQLLGVIALQKIDWVNRSAELAILIGNKDAHGKGFGKQACALMCRHGFDQLNLHRIYLGTHQDNIGMQKVAEALGMTLEGRTRQAFYKHGQYADLLHYGILKEEFTNADLGIDQS